MLLNWKDLDSAPEVPGLYAWYYRPLITTKDVQKLIEEISKNEDSEKKRVAKKFLKEKVFSPFQELPYEVKVSGQLKPEFIGQITHKMTISSDIIEKFVSHPEDAWGLKTLFESEIQALASPLYVGMAKKSLRERLKQHRKKIGDLRGNNQPEVKAVDFATTVVARGMRPTHLSVYVREFNDVKKISNLENVINRIFFPIIGRN